MAELDKDSKEILEEMRKDGVLPKEEDSIPPKEEPVKPDEQKEKEKPKEEEKEIKVEEKIPRPTEEKYVEPWQLRRLEKTISKQVDSVLEKVREIAERPVATPQGEERKAENIGKAMDRIKQIAEESGIDPEPLTRVAEAILQESQSNLSESVKKIDELAQKEKDKEFWAEQDKKFNEEFDQVKEVDDFKDAFGKLSASELSDVREQLRKLNFTEKYHSYSIRDLLIIKKDEILPERKRTAESGRGGMNAKKAHGADLSGKVILSDSQIKDLSDEEFDMYSENLARESKGFLRRGGEDVKN